MIYLYRQPEQNEQLVIGADPSEGRDYSAFVVISKKYADVVMLGRSKTESPQLGYELNHVGQYLKKRTNILPTIAVERNTGAATIHVLKTLNYAKLFKMPRSFTTSQQEITDDYGWSTNTATRPKMLDDLALAVRQRSIKIYSKELIDEMFTFIRNAKTGKPQADVGSNDDLVMSTAICWQLYQIVPVHQTDSYYYQRPEYKPYDPVIGI